MTTSATTNTIMSKINKLCRSPKISADATFTENHTTLFSVYGVTGAEKVIFKRFKTFLRIGF